ncbi:MAG: M23 family metallopeptidase [Gemmiger sp.]
MWQDAAQTQSGQQQSERKEQNWDHSAANKPVKEYGNTLLWGQILLCALVLALAAAARQFDLPWYRTMRETYREMLACGWEAFPYDGRNLIKFTQEAFSSAEQAAREALSAKGLSRPVPHGRAQEDAPYGSSLESYLPQQDAVYPLSDDALTNSGYGWRQSPSVLDSKEDFHTGDDLDAAEGAPVYAVMDGVVRRASCGDSYGNYLRILHEDGDETLYAHLQYIFVRSGEPVQKGQLIGTVGQTGKATGPHLHFELLHWGVRYDPTEFLQTFCA